MAVRRKKRRSHNAQLIGLIAVLVVLLILAVSFVVDIANIEHYDKLTIQVGAALPEAADFLPDSEETEKGKTAFVTDITAINSNVPGVYDIQISCAGKLLSVQLIIEDTAAPSLQVQDLTVFNPESLKPEDFVTQLQDDSQVKLSFARTPDLTVQGTQNVTIIATDAGGNTVQLQAVLTVIWDREAPQILGVKDIDTYVGESVAYRSGVTVADDSDTAPGLAIDSSQVDLSAPGTYTVTYTATDHSGKTASVTAKVTVREKKDDHVDPEVIYAAVDALLDKFIREDMTDREKVEAVYCWTRLHLKYGSAPDADDWLQTAYRFLQTHKGDCYSFFSIQKLMFQRLNIPTVDVKKVKNFEGDTNHYWLLVSIDGGKSYYHFDNVWSKALCLVTDAELDEFSEAVESHPFNRDKSLYPATPTEELPDSELPWNDPAIVNTLP